MWNRLLCTALLAHASIGVWAASGDAASYPSRPIRVIDGNPPGGSADYMARIIGPKLTERFGQTVIVDNRPGASGNLGAEITARANADGYTLMLAVISTLASSRSLYSKLGYDLLKDFSYITLVATGAQVLVAHPSMPDSLSELVALARSKPKAIRYGSAGLATTTHLAMELLQNRAGIELLHVPYKGTAPFTPALVGGEISIGFTSAPSAISLIEAKRIKALAVTSTKRLGVLPGVPTVAESGFPRYDARNILGIIAPAGTPAAVVKLLNTEIRNILQMNDIVAKTAVQGFEAAGSTPDEFKAITEAAVAQSARIIKDANITVN